MFRESITRVQYIFTYPAPITTIFNGRATKALGMRSIAGNVKESCRGRKEEDLQG
jgi:hypothetical protein